MNFGLIALDLDGTALREDHMSFSPRLDRALLEAHRRGVAVVPVTGRQYALLPPAIGGKNQWENLAVLSNGAEVRRLNTGLLLESHYLSGPDLLPLIEGALRLGLPIEVSSAGTLYLTGADWALERTLPSLSFHVEHVLARWGREVDDLSAFCADFSGVFEKVNLPHIPDQRQEEVRRMLSALPLSSVWSSSHGVEVTHREATKAGGLLAVCRLLGVDPARTIALGDSGNDVPMLQAAGLGVAMGNAPDWVKAQARTVTAHNREDGAALAIEQYVLGG